MLVVMNGEVNETALSDHCELPGLWHCFVQQCLKVEDDFPVIFPPGASRYSHPALT